MPKALRSLVHAVRIALTNNTQKSEIFYQGTWAIFKPVENVDTISKKVNRVIAISWTVLFS